jgi:hypothetical protein
LSSAVHPSPFSFVKSKRYPRSADVRESKARVPRETIMARAECCYDIPKNVRSRSIKATIVHPRKRNRIEALMTRDGRFVMIDTSVSEIGEPSWLPFRSAVNRAELAVTRHTASILSRANAQPFSLFPNQIRPASSRLLLSKPRLDNRGHTQSRLAGRMFSGRDAA